MMNDRARVTRRRRPTWPPAVRFAAIIAAAALALLAAACSSSSSGGSGGAPNAGGSAKTPSAIAYSHCMRSHSVPNFPDPPSGGGIAKGSAQELGVSSSVFEAAQRACQSLIPSTGSSAQQEEQRCFVGNDCPPSVVQQLLNLMRQFSRCMRSHGEPNFPDPTTDSHGQPFFDVSAQGISDAATHSPRFINRLDECQRLVGNFPYTFG
jgi:hypothetical protein